MTTFCTDADLLYWEPDILREAAWASQTLATGTGDVSGTLFTATSAAPFLERKVEPGQVLCLTGTVNGCFPIVSVDGAPWLRVSLLHGDLFAEPPDEPAEMVPIGDCVGVAYAVRTLWPQRRLVSDLLLQAAGIVPGEAGSTAWAGAAVLNPRALRRPCALGVLHMVFDLLASAATDPAAWSTRADLYERLFRRALRQAVVDLDLDGDGSTDTRRHLGTLQLVRA